MGKHSRPANKQAVISGEDSSMGGTDALGGISHSISSVSMDVAIGESNFGTIDVHATTLGSTHTQRLLGRFIH